MLTEKQKQAIEAMLTLHKDGSITQETALTVIEAVFEGTSSVQYIPYTTKPYENPFGPTVTYTNGGTNDNL